jgi:hypothetical protein
MKKRKLNSKNPKYMKRVGEPKIRERVQIQCGGHKVYAVYLEN